MKDPQQSSQSSSSSQSQLLPPSPLSIDYWACQYSSWYPTFSRPFPGRKRGLTIPSYIIHWPPPSRSPNDDNDDNNDNVDNNVDNVLIRYLKEDGIQLPPNTQPSSCLSCQPRRRPSSTSSSSSDDDDSDEEDHDWDSHDNVEKVDQVSNRPHYYDDYDHGLNSLTQEITLAIQQLGGCVIPKLNWSTPKDAIWINEGTLKCTTAGDVYLLFKSSDFIASDVQLLESLLLQEEEEQKEQRKEQQQTTAIRKNDKNNNDTTNNDKVNNKNNKNKNGIQIVLRKYANLYPSSEFRCFVKNHCLVAISQRHDDLYFEHLQIMKQEYEEQTTTRKQSDHHSDNIVFQEQQDHDNDDSQEFLSSSSSSSHTCWIHVIQEVMTDWIIPNFAHGQVSNFVVDVYMDQQNRLWILDFNVWGIRTDSLLFDWNELQQQQQFGNNKNNNKNDKNDNNNNDNNNENHKNGYCPSSSNVATHTFFETGNIQNDENNHQDCINNNNTKQQQYMDSNKLVVSSSSSSLVEFRVVQTEKEVRSHGLNNFRVPIDTMHIASITGGNVNGCFEAFMNLCQKQQEEEDDDENDDDYEDKEDDRKACTKEKKEDEEKDDERLS